MLEDNVKITKPKNAFWQVFGKKDLWWLISSLLIILAFPVYIYSNPSDTESKIDIWAGMWFVFIIIIAIKWSNFKSQILLNFAKSHGFGKGLLDVNKFERDPESIFSQGLKYTLQDYYSNPAGFEIFSIEVVYSEGENGNSIPYTILSTNLRKDYPFAQALKRGLWFKPGHYYDYHLSKTESNEFNKKYLLSAHKPQDAFYVFNPTIISILQDTKNRFNIEVDGNKLLLFTDKEIAKTNDYEEMWQALNMIKDALE